MTMTAQATDTPADDARRLVDRVTAAPWFADMADAEADEWAAAVAALRQAVGDAADAERRVAAGSLPSVALIEADGDVRGAWLRAGHVAEMIEAQVTKRRAEAVAELPGRVAALSGAAIVAAADRLEDAAADLVAAVEDYDAAADEIRADARGLGVSLASLVFPPTARVGSMVAGAARGPLAEHRRHSDAGDVWRAGERGADAIRRIREET